MRKDKTASGRFCLPRPCCSASPHPRIPAFPHPLIPALPLGRAFAPPPYLEPRPPDGWPPASSVAEIFDAIEEESAIMQMTKTKTGMLALAAVLVVAGCGRKENNTDTTMGTSG